MSSPQRGGPVNPSISRATILKAAHQHAASIEQWSKSGDYERASHYTARLEALVELLEADDCGSVGGYDKKRGQPDVWRLAGRERLKDRLSWLSGLPMPSEAATALSPAAEWLDRNEQEALSGSLRYVLRQHNA